MLKDRHLLNFFRLPLPLLHLHLPTLGDHRHELGLVVGRRGDVLDLPQRQQSIQQLPKHDVLPVQEIRLGAGDEKLAAVGVGPTVRLEREKKTVDFQ